MNENQLDSPQQLYVALREHLRRADERDVDHARPSQLAHALQAPIRPTLETLVDALFDGDVILHWELECPMCKAHSEISNVFLTPLHEATCASCGADFRVHADQETQVTFSPHPRIRELALPAGENKAYHDALHHQYPATTVQELMTVQRFRDWAQNEPLQGNAYLEVRKMTLWFSDLTGSTALYARNGDRVPLVFPGPQLGPDVRTFDATIADLSVARMVEIGQEVIAYLREIDPDVLLNVTLKRGVNQATIRNQAGADVAFKRSPFSLMIEVHRVKGDDILIMFDMVGATVWDSDYMLAARRLGDKLRQAQQISVLTPGRMPVLFSPTGALVLGLPLMEGVDGKNVYKGISPLAGKVGETLFDDKLTLVDDPTVDGKFGSAAYDDEGVPHRRNVLIGQGKLNGFLYDLKTAAQSGVESTGNGSRGLFNQPNPAPTNLIIAPGETPLTDMITGIDEGLLVQDVLGLGQGNVLSGAFSNPIALGFKIEKGEIVGRVKDVSIAGNIYDVLQNIAAVSRESEWIYTNFNAPYILLEEMNVAGKT